MNRKIIQKRVVETYLSMQKKWKQVIVSAKRSIRGELMSRLRFKWKDYIRSLSPTTTGMVIENLKSTQKNEFSSKDHVFKGIVRNREKVMKELNLESENKNNIKNIFMLGSDLFKRRYKKWNNNSNSI